MEQQSNTSSSGVVNQKVPQHHARGTQRDPRSKRYKVRERPNDPSPASREDVSATQPSAETTPAVSSGSGDRADTTSVKANTEVRKNKSHDKSEKENSNNFSNKKPQRPKQGKKNGKTNAAAAHMMASLVDSLAKQSGERDAKREIKKDQEEGPAFNKKIDHDAAVLKIQSGEVPEEQPHECILPKNFAVKTEWIYDPTIGEGHISRFFLAYLTVPWLVFAALPKRVTRFSVSCVILSWLLPLALRESLISDYSGRRPGRVWYKPWTWFNSMEREELPFGFRRHFFDNIFFPIRKGGTRNFLSTMISWFTGRKEERIFEEYATRRISPMAVARPALLATGKVEYPLMHLHEVQMRYRTSSQMFDRIDLDGNIMEGPEKFIVSAENLTHNTLKILGLKYETDESKTIVQERMMSYFANSSKFAWNRYTFLRGEDMVSNTVLIALKLHESRYYNTRNVRIGKRDWEPKYSSECPKTILEDDECFAKPALVENETTPSSPPTPTPLLSSPSTPLPSPPAVLLTPAKQDNPPHVVEPHQPSGKLLNPSHTLEEHLTPEQHERLKKALYVANNREQLETLVPSADPLMETLRQANVKLQNARPDPGLFNQEFENYRIMDPADESPNYCTLLSFMYGTETSRTLAMGLFTTLDVDHNGWFLQTTPWLASYVMGYNVAVMMSDGQSLMNFGFDRTVVFVQSSSHTALVVPKTSGRTFVINRNGGRKFLHGYTSLDNSLIKFRENPTKVIVKQLRKVNPPMAILHEDSPDVCDPRSTHTDTQFTIKSVVHRIAGYTPEPDEQTIQEFSEFVKKFVKTIPPLPPETDVSSESWIINHPTYSAVKKQQLLELHKNFWKKVDPATVKCFVKAETYPEPKPARGIYARSDEMKIKFGPWFHAIEQKVYSLPYFIKKIPVQERPGKLKELIAEGRKYVVTDYTSFESHFTEQMMAACEFHLYRHMVKLIPGSEDFINEMETTLAGMNKLTFKDITAYVRARRMSGEMNTSLGNGFSNLMFTLFMCEKTGVEAIGYVEGDDGIFAFNGKPPGQEMFAKLGLNVKYEEVPSPLLASFCGIIADEESLTNLVDVAETIRNFWQIDARYAKASEKTLNKIILCKAYSMLYEHPNCPIIHELALYYIRKFGRLKIKRFLMNSSYLNNYEKARLSGLMEQLPQAVEGKVAWSSRIIVQEKFGIMIEEQLRVEKSLKQDVLPGKDEWPFVVYSSWGVDTCFSFSSTNNDDLFCYDYKIASRPVAKGKVSQAPAWRTANNKEARGSLRAEDSAETTMATNPLQIKRNGSANVVTTDDIDKLIAAANSELEKAAVVKKVSKKAERKLRTRAASAAKKDSKKTADKHPAPAAQEFVRKKVAKALTCLRKAQRAMKRL